MKREWNLRNIYLYLVSFVTLMMIIAGTVQLIRATVHLLYPPPPYYAGPVEIKMRMGDPDVSPELIEEQARLERERQEQHLRHEQARRLAESLALLAVALPTYIYHWRKIQQEAHVDQPPN